MFKARSSFAAILASLFTAAVLAGASWASAVAAAQGYSATKLPGLLTMSNFAPIEWPFRTDQPPFEVHLAFYLGIGITAVVAGLTVAIALRKASPRNSGAAFVSTWFGVILGSLLAAIAVYFVRVDSLAAEAAQRNGVLLDTLQSMVFAALLIGWLPALFAWLGFAIANRKAAAAQQDAIDAAEGNAADENPFDFAPGSVGEPRPVEPGFTYPAGDEHHDGSYTDSDLGNAERDQRTQQMTFTDPTDATGEDLGDRSNDYGSRSNDYRTRSAGYETGSTNVGPDPATDFGSDPATKPSGGSNLR